MGGIGPFACALVEAIKVSDNLKVKDAIFCPLRLIIKFVVRPSLYYSEKENGAREARDLRRLQRSGRVWLRTRRPPWIMR